MTLLRDELRKGEPSPVQPETNGSTTTVAPTVAGGDARGTGVVTPPIDIPAPTRRYSRVHLRFTGLRVAKTSNLQPYLFKVLQEQNAAAELVLTVEVTSGAGLGADVPDRRIVEAFEQLGIGVTWEPA